MGQWFVTGGTGFIGRHVIQHLLNQQQEIVALARRPEVLEKLFPRIHIVPGDLESISRYLPILATCTGVIHLAGLIKARNTQEYEQVNAMGTRSLVEALYEIPHDIRLVYMSSLAAIGPSLDGNPVDESTLPHPVSAYGASKLKGEQFVRTAPSHVKWTILRPPAVYGPGDRAFLPYFRITQKGWNLYIGDPTRRFSLVYVHDLAEGLLHVLMHKAAVGKTYFITDPNEYTWESVAKTLTQIFGIPRPRKIIIPQKIILWTAAWNEWMARIFRREAFFSRDKVEEILQPSWVCSGLKLSTELGFTPSTPLQEGLLATLRWYQKHHWLPNRRLPRRG